VPRESHAFLAGLSQP